MDGSDSKNIVSSQHQEPVGDAEFYLSLMRAYLDSANDGIFVLCDERKFHVANRLLASWLGENEASLTVHNGRVPITEFLGAETSQAAFDEHFHEALAGRPTRFECFMHPPNGRPRWVDISMNRVDIEGGDLVIGVVRDVTEQKTALLRMEHQAIHDELTGLVNRRQFMNELEHLLHVAMLDHAEHALLCLDLDQFKVINDTCGHVAGDELLRELAALIKTRVRASDVVGRLGGDEFAVILAECSTARAMRVADSIREAFSAYRFTWEDRSFELGVSIGVATVAEDARDAKTILSRADAACYVAKDKGRNRVQLYSGGDDCEIKRAEMDWVSRITQALDEERFCLYYQSVKPVSAFAPCQTHKEILVRMVDPQGRIVSPGQFMPAAEKYNLMGAIDRWVIRSVFAAKANEWRDVIRSCGDKGTECNAFTAINLSGASLNDETFFAFLKEHIHKHEVPPRSVCFEITETVAINNLNRVANFIAELKAMGFRFALDDFGSGVSSFSYLKALPVDFIKIDGALVRGIVNSSLDLRIVESIAYVAQEMGVKTIAEFVENEEILRRLRSIGIDYAQGYGIHKPEPLM
jgi:diguanylate cyclase (GGDEF)-like protein/PAS domain S-box-containing protein